MIIHFTQLQKLIICTTLAIVVGCGLGIYTEKQLQPTVVSVDLSELIKTMSQYVSKMQLSPQERKETLSLVANQLDSSLETYAAKHHVIIVPRQALIAGGKDITADIFDELFSQSPAKGRGNE